jgi:hypothetical protein
VPALSVKQVIHAARQLSQAERRVVIAELQKAPSRAEVQRAFRRLRGKHRMPGAKQARMSKLLATANERSLSVEESQELDRLVQEYEERTLELVQEVRTTVTPSGRNGSGARRRRHK